MRISDWSSRVLFRSTHLCGAPDYIEDGPTGLMTGGNVKEAQLVRPRRVIEARLLHRIARIGEIDEIDAFHHAPIGDVQAGNDSGANCHISKIGRAACRERVCQYV